MINLSRLAEMFLTSKHFQKIAHMLTFVKSKKPPIQDVSNHIKTSVSSSDLQTVAAEIQTSVDCAITELDGTRFSHSKKNKTKLKTACHQLKNLEP